MTRRCRLAVPVLLGLGLVPVVGVVGAAPASALSCVGPETVLEGAESVLVGRVVDVSDGVATIDVEEVWRGPDLPAQVRYAVGLEVWMPWADRSGEVPDGFSSPQRWVFAPWERDDGVEEINPCGLFRPGQDGVRQARPDDPRGPVGSEGSGAGPGSGEAGSAAAPGDEPLSPMPVVDEGTPTEVWVAAGAGVLAGAGLLGGWAARRRRTARTPLM